MANRLRIVLFIYSRGAIREKPTWGITLKTASQVENKNSILSRQTVAACLLTSKSTTAGGTMVTFYHVTILATPIHFSIERYQQAIFCDILFPLLSPKV